MKPLKEAKQYYESVQSVVAANAELDKLVEKAKDLREAYKLKVNETVMNALNLTVNDRIVRVSHIATGVIRLVSEYDGLNLHLNYSDFPYEKTEATDEEIKDDAQINGTVSVILASLDFAYSRDNILDEAFKALCYSRIIDVYARAIRVMPELFPILSKLELTFRKDYSDISKATAPFVEIRRLWANKIADDILDDLEKGDSMIGMVPELEYKEGQLYEPRYDNETATKIRVKYVLIDPATGAESNHFEKKLFPRDDVRNSIRSQIW